MRTSLTYTFYLICCFCFFLFENIGPFIPCSSCCIYIQSVDVSTYYIVYIDRDQFEWIVLDWNVIVYTFL